MGDHDKNLGYRSDIIERSAKSIRVGRTVASVAAIMRLQEIFRGNCPECGMSGLCEHRLTAKPVILPFG
jgi:hypothetical protein